MLFVQNPFDTGKVCIGPYLCWKQLEATFSNLTYLALYTSLQECFDKLVISHEIRSDLFICNYMIVKE